VIALFWSPQSLDDLESIRAYIAQDSPVYADLVVRRLVAAVERLRGFPESGRSVPERNDPRIREILERPYRIVYRVLPGQVEIVMVFHASRLFPDIP
jgi:addiction module RelE/StbE family toxin